MGLLDFLGKKEGEKTVPKIPFQIKAHFTPIRMNLKETTPVDLKISVKNLLEEDVVTSIVTEAPKAVGFDSTVINSTREIRLGHLRPGEEREILVPVYGNPAKTNPGEYAIGITAYAHYRDYAHILNSAKKTLMLRVI